MDQEVHGNFLCGFLRKNLICGNLVFSGQFLMFDWVSSQLSQAAVTIAYLKSQDMIKTLNSQDMISQVNFYVEDTVLRYYMVLMYGGQYST